MRSLMRLCVAWFFVGIVIVPVTAFADADPRPGSAGALNGLVESYRGTVAQLFKFEAATEGVVTSNIYLNYRDQVLATVLTGLDNIDNSAANQLIADLSAVYLGESAGPLYSCVVQRKAKTLAVYLQKGRPLSSWCSKDLPRKFCVKEEEALQRLRSSLKKAKNSECDIPLY